MRAEQVARGFVNLLRDDRGQAVTEYILVIGLIVAPIAVAFNRLQPVLKRFAHNINLRLSGPGV